VILRRVPEHPTAAILTIGNEVVAGDIENTNAPWLARRLEQLGLAVKLVAAVTDEIESIAELVAREAPRVDVLVVTGGLGGTPDDVTREALAAAFGVGRAEQAEVAGRLRERFPHAPEFAAAWATLPEGARPLEIPGGGAPGFVLDNVYVLPGLPGEMKPMFDSVADEIRRGEPIAAWRRSFRTRESAITPLLVAAVDRYPGVVVGSYPTFAEEGPRVEVVLKSSDSELLEAARAWLEAELEALAE
jgi:molybdenum cofactor synthesis domain-containing protein